MELNALVTVEPPPLKLIWAMANAVVFCDPVTVSVPVRISPGSTVASGKNVPYSPGPKF
jgi:hypothetical protein